jgi:pimeloyl-ACP methyl ester carboxylesterase
MWFPAIEPYATGLLDTGDGNLVYWETCGNPEGAPVLIVHGGPGAAFQDALMAARDKLSMTITA